MALVFHTCCVTAVFAFRAVVGGGFDGGGVGVAIAFSLAVLPFCCYFCACVIASCFQSAVECEVENTTKQQRNNNSQTTKQPRHTNSNNNNNNNSQQQQQQQPTTTATRKQQQTNNRQGHNKQAHNEHLCAS